MPSHNINWTKRTKGKTDMDCDTSKSCSADRHDHADAEPSTGIPGEVEPMTEDYLMAVTCCLPMESDDDLESTRSVSKAERQLRTPDIGCGEAAPAFRVHPMEKGACCP